MNKEIKVTESPRHLMVLDSISRGIQDVFKISTITKISEQEVELILNDLTLQKLIVVEGQYKNLLDDKFEARITHTGNRFLFLKKEELEEKARELKGMYRNEDKRGMELFMNVNRVWIPMMIFSRIISAMAFASMMYFIRLTINPIEAALAADAVNIDGRNSADTQMVPDGYGMDNARRANSDNSTNSSGFDVGGE
jgi:hypothetical protein